LKSIRTWIIYQPSKHWQYSISPFAYFYHYHIINQLVDENKAVTITTTTCKRTDLITRTIDSFLECVLDYKKYDILLHKSELESIVKICDYINNKKLHGDIVECGVWKGGSAVLLSILLNRSKFSPIRNFWLADYFGSSYKFNILGYPVGCTKYLFRWYPLHIQHQMTFCAKCGNYRFNDNEDIQECCTCKCV
jgi:hypothetical protein